MNNFFNEMFDNMGRKIKTLAKILCSMGIIASIILSFITIANAVKMSNGALLALGICIMIIGPLFSWVGSFFTYGFGEIVDKLDSIEFNTRHINQKTQSKTSNSYQSQQKAFDNTDPLVTLFNEIEKDN